MTDGLTPSDLIAHGQKLQRKFERARRKWARAIGHPIRGHEAEPDPGTLDAEDPELG